MTREGGLRKLQDTVSKRGVDCLWIYHLNDARDAQANEIMRATLSRTERALLHLSLNLQLSSSRKSATRSSGRFPGSS